MDESSIIADGIKLGYEKVALKTYVDDRLRKEEIREIEREKRDKMKDERIERL
jgi:hypothetical protein